MASASSHDIWRGRGRQPQTLGNARPRHRSESRRLSDSRRPVKAAARKRDHSPGALHEGDAIRVFSRSAEKWVECGVARCVEGNFVRVEYEIDEYWCGKVLHIHSELLAIPAALDNSCEEVDLGHRGRPSLNTGDLVEALRSKAEPWEEYKKVGKYLYEKKLAHRQFSVPEKYAKKALMADFLASKAVAREGGEQSRIGLQLIDTAVRRLEQRGCRNHSLPGYDGKQPFDIVTNDDLRLHHLDSTTKQNIDWLEEYKQYAEMTTHGVLAIVDNKQSFKDWLCSGACHRETSGLRKGRFWVFLNSDDEDWIQSPGALLPELQNIVDQALFELVKAGRTEQVQRVLKEWHADPNALDAHGLRPLVYAFVIHGHSHDTVRALIDNGAEKADIDFVELRRAIIDRDYPDGDEERLLQGLRIEDCTRSLQDICRSQQPSDVRRAAQLQDLRDKHEQRGMQDFG